ncbi:molybdate ABC transporter substrate-binding protein [uncultured Tateyamaria sp.]|uniref:molybdate ABC transporter substrate-binding protein n=1 Tax=uncultured Tateyamaria sp. TaxID=455651 RepID=UPI00262B0A50|nr:molybdate ABC transporter substrate-binding protein [uncultured Tateyamaria sp.]
MKTYNWIKGLALMLALACLSAQANADPLRIFAAASLQGPLDAIAEHYDVNSTVSYGGSGTLARQVSLGAPADIVILANKTWADWLLDEGHTETPARPILSNRLVLIAPNGTTAFDQMDGATLRTALGDGRLAMGQHQSVPGGIYAKAWLTHLGAWENLRPHLAETENVRAALALVARKETPLGIVYASDAQASGQVGVVWTIPAEQHPQILYHAVALSPSGQAFLDHLTQHTAPFVAAGFVALP